MPSEVRLRPRLLPAAAERTAEVIFLNLVSFTNESVFLDSLSAFREGEPAQLEFHNWFESREFEHLKAMLIMFLACHVLVVRRQGTVVTSSG